MRQREWILQIKDDRLKLKLERRYTSREGAKAAAARWRSDRPTFQGEASVYHQKGGEWTARLAPYDSLRLRWRRAVNAKVAA